MKRKFNIVDVVLIALVVLVAVGALALRDRSTGATAARETTPMRFTVEFISAPHGMTGAMTAGDDVYRSTDGAYLGKIVDFYAVPHVENKYSPVTGDFARYECVENDDVYLTIEGDGYATAREITMGSVVLRIGTELAVKGRGYAKAGYIIGVDTMDAVVAEDTNTGTGSREATYLLSFDDAREFYASNIHVGDRFYDGGTSGTGALLGIVQSVSVTPHGETVIGTDGEPHWAEKPGRSKIVVELKGRFVDKADGYYLDGAAELKIGATVTVRTRYFERQAMFYELVNIGDAQ